MIDLLTPSTTEETLEALQAKKAGVHCPYLRLRQKGMDKKEWLVDGQIHNGAHFPLCVFTNNARARSAEKAAKRAHRKGQGAQGTKGAQGKGRGAKGKSERRNEFGELPPPAEPPNEPSQHSWETWRQQPLPPPQSRHNWQQPTNWQQSSDNWQQSWSSCADSRDGVEWSWNAQTGWGWWTYNAQTGWIFCSPA